MAGNDRRRFCGQCQLNVYNLSGMTKREAEELLNQTEGRLCVRFYRRADGTILTQDCPVGLRALKRRISRIATATLSTVLGFFSGLGLNLAITETAPQPTTMGTIPAQKLSTLVSPVDSNTPSGEIMMGDIAPTETGRAYLGDDVTTSKERKSGQRRRLKK
jgi:hypothetical protein